MITGIDCDAPGHDGGDAILDRLTSGWRVAQPSYDPGRRVWDVTAVGPKRGGRRGPPPETIVGEGVDELAALVDLAEKIGTP